MLRTTQSSREFFFNTTNVGQAREPSVTGRSASFACGAVLQISLHVDESQTIKEARFKAAGCSALVAAASFLTEAVTGKTTGEAAILGQDLDAIGVRLGPLEQRRNECYALAAEALISAITQYSDSVRDEWEGDEALICTCFSVAERRLENEIRSNRLTTVAEVTAACNAGAGCRSCYPLIEDILEEVNRKW